MALNFMQEAIEELYRCFDIINEAKFENKLPNPVIVIQFDKKAYGHCSIHKIWTPVDSAPKTNDDYKADEATERPEDEVDEFFEVMIASNFLNRGPKEIAHTLIHECCHLYNLAVVKKSDCTGQKHNKRFKAVCDKVGLDCGDKHPKFGYGLTALTPELETWIVNELKPDASKFSYFCNFASKPKEKDETEKKKFVAWVCPGCGREAKFEEDLENVLCGDCNMPFELKPKGKRGRKAKNSDDED